MGVKRLLGATSWVLILGGIVCLVVALITPRWRGTGDYTEGIFQNCQKNKCKDVVLFDGQGTTYNA